MTGCKNSTIVSVSIILLLNERPWGDETVWYENPETNPLAQCLCQTGSEPGGLRIETAGQVVTRQDKAIHITGPICAKQIEAKSLCNGAFQELHHATPFFTLFFFLICYADM